MKKWIGLIFILLTVTSAQAVQTTYNIETDSKRTILNANTANDTEEYANIDAFVLQSGLSALDTNYGTFTGLLLPNDSVAKVLFQTIETELESVTTKTNFVTVTQDVNLDTMESDIASNNTFRTTPSTEIVAGTNLDWDGNTLNVIGTGSVNISGTPLANDYARWINGDTIEGRSYTEVKVDLGLDEVDNTSDLDKTISTLTQNALNLKVNNTGDETIAGIKTFSSYPIGPAIDPTTDNQLATKRYVDENGGSFDEAGDYSLTGSWDYTGASAFSVGPSNYVADGTLPDTEGYNRYNSGITGFGANLFTHYSDSKVQYHIPVPTLPTITGQAQTYNSITDEMDWTIPSGTNITYQTSDPTNSDDSGIYVNTTDGDAFFVDQYVGISTWTTTYTPAQTEFYVSSAGLDSNPGTELLPWLTVSKVVNTTIDPGSSVYFNRGDTFADTRLRLLYSGEPGSLITYSSYGSGALPIIRSVYNRFSQSGALHDVTVEAINLKGDPSDVLSIRGVDFSGTYTNVTIVNCTIDSYVNEGIYYYGSGSEYYTDLLIDTNYIHSNDLSGIFIKVENSDISNVRINENTVVGNILDVSQGQPATNYDNITVSGGLVLIENNWVDSTGADAATGFFGSGVDLDTRVATVRYNTIKGVDLGDAAFSIKSFTGDIYHAYGNIITNGGGSGIQMTSRDVTGGTIYLYNNVIANNIGVGITRTVVAPLYMSNNIFFDNGSSDPAHTWHTSEVFCFDNGTITGDPRDNITADNNLYYTTESVPMNRNRRTVATEYDTSLTFAQWQALPHDLNGLDSDPVFVSAATGNYRLDTGSPALTTGETLPDPYDFGITYASTIAPNNININLLTRLPAYDMGAFQAAPVVGALFSWSCDTLTAETTGGTDSATITAASDGTPSTSHPSNNIQIDLGTWVWFEANQGNNIDYNAGSLSFNYTYVSGTPTSSTYVFSSTFTAPDQFALRRSSSDTSLVIFFAGASYNPTVTENIFSGNHDISLEWVAATQTLNLIIDTSTYNIGLASTAVPSPDAPQRIYFNGINNAFAQQTILLDTVVIE